MSENIKEALDNLAELLRHPEYPEHVAFWATTAIQNILRDIPTNHV